MNRKLLTGILVALNLIAAACLLYQKSGVAQVSQIPKVAQATNHESMSAISQENNTPVTFANDTGGTRSFGDGLIKYGASFEQLMCTLWSLKNRRMNERTVELLQITDAEAGVITHELNKLQDKYYECITSNGRLVEETDERAKFRVAPFAEDAQSANQHFLDSLKAQVSEGTYNLMLDGMPIIVQMMGHNGEPLEIIIRKNPYQNGFLHIDIKSENNRSKTSGVWNLHMHKKEAAGLYGQLVTNNSSRILD